MPEIPLVQKILIYAIPIIFAITVHEVAHGWVASKLGDQTARLMGRLTLNPIKHMDPVGTVLVPMLMILFTPFVFGWARPVPVDWRNLRQPKRDMALVAIAGPGANLIMLIIWILFTLLVNKFSVIPPYSMLLLNEMAGVGIIINIILIVLNLIPLPPLDGSRIVQAFLSPTLALKYHQLERWGLLILVALMFTGVLGRILGPVVGFLLTFIDTIIVVS